MRTKMYAFELVEYVLYVYALWVFCTATLFHTNSSLGIDVHITYILLGAVFLCALIRNYVVMMGIDRHDDDDSLYQFLGGLGLLGRNVERTVRFLIIAAIITTPEGLFSFSSTPLKGLSERFADQHPAFIAAKRSSEHSDIISFYTSLYYYALVALIMFLLFLLWDLTVAFSMQRRISERRVSADVDFHNDRVTDPTYRSVLLYFNICEHTDIDDGDSLGGVSFKSFITRRKGPRSRVEQGRIVRLYFGSPKAWERMSGIAFAAFIILAAATNMSMYLVFLALGLSLGLYFMFAWANEGYLSSIMSFPFLWLTYWIEPSALARVWAGASFGIEKTVFVPIRSIYNSYMDLAGHGAPSGDERGGAAQT